VAEPSDNSTETTSESLLLPTGDGVVIDIGTGDGLFVYRSAREQPSRFFIGIDASARPLEKVSEKIYRKPAKGGLRNALFIQAAVEDLPEELDAVADEVHVHFPWGSLLRAVATGESEVLGNLRRICSEGALLEVIIGLDPVRDRAEIERLSLPALSEEHVDCALIPRYRSEGFEIFERGTLLSDAWARLHTSWAKRLRGNPNRSLLYLIARAC
jgi:16S rRNA (adenine(1408)-N(1))-methyltransferase